MRVVSWLLIGCWMLGALVDRSHGAEDHEGAVFDKRIVGSFKNFIGYFGRSHCLYRGTDRCIHGTCHWSGARCDCYSGYEGDYCEFLSSPAPTPSTTQEPIPVTEVQVIPSNINDLASTAETITDVVTVKSTTEPPKSISTTQESTTKDGIDGAPSNPLSTNVTATTLIPILSTTLSPEVTTIKSTTASSTPESTSPSSEATPKPIAPSTPIPTVRLSNFMPDCPFADYCTLVANNKHCDPRCDVKECFFDGGDCAPESINRCPETCAFLRGNGVCDDICNIEACNFDGPDCTLTSLKSLGKLQLIIGEAPEKFNENETEKFLTKLYSLTEIPVSYARRDDGQKEIYHWSKENGMGDLISFNDSLKAGEKVAPFQGVLLSVVFNFTSCQQSEGACRFKNVDEIAEYLNTAPNDQVKENLGYPVYEARVMAPENTNSSPSNPWSSVLTIVVCVTLGIMVGVSVQQRKRKQSQLPSDYDDPSIYYCEPKKPHLEPTFTPFSDLPIIAKWIREKYQEPAIIQALQHRLDHGQSIEWMDDEKTTLLHLAVKYRRFEVATFLLNCQAKTNVRDSDGLTPLSDLINDSPGSLQMFQKLLKAPDVDVNVIIDTDLTLLKLACENDAYLPFVETLLSHPGIKMNLVGIAKDRKCMRQNVIHHAAIHGSCEILKVLIAHDGKNDEKSLLCLLDDWGRTPLVCALQFEKWDAAKILIKHMNWCDLSTGISALTIAKQAKAQELVDLMKAKEPKTKPVEALKAPIASSNFTMPNFTPQFDIPVSYALPVMPPPTIPNGNYFMPNPLPEMPFSTPPTKYQYPQGLPQTPVSTKARKSSRRQPQALKTVQQAPQFHFPVPPPLPPTTQVPPIPQHQVSQPIQPPGFVSTPASVHSQYLQPNNPSHRSQVNIYQCEGGFYPQMSQANRYSNQWDLSQPPYQPPQYLPPETNYLTTSQAAHSNLRRTQSFSVTYPNTSQTQAYPIQQQSYYNPPSLISQQTYNSPYLSPPQQASLNQTNSSGYSSGYNSCLTSPENILSTYQ